MRQQLKQEELEVKSAKELILKMWGLSKVKRFFKERREKYLEEAFIETNFSVALDTNDLSNNLNLLKGSNHIFSERDSEYIYKRLREKAKLIRESYDDGIFNYMAGAFGFYKNPCSHRDVDMDFIQAFERIFLSNYLLKII